MHMPFCRFCHALAYFLVPWSIKTFVVGTHVGGASSKYPQDMFLLRLGKIVPDLVSNAPSE